MYDECMYVCVYVCVCMCVCVCVCEVIERARKLQRIQDKISWA